MTNQGRATGEALVAWARGLDAELKRAGAVSVDNRRTAAAMIESAKNEADTEQHRGGHRSTARRELMPWEVAREQHVAELIEACLRGRFTRRTFQVAS